jgi:tetratricopeptide (TPR) repeat protein
VTGTPAYSSPEQAQGRGDELTERADVFSLGAILCEILTGAPPYVDDVPAAAPNARLDDAHRRLDACGADAGLVTLAKACLSPRPEDRPRSAREVAEALDAHLSEAQRNAHAAGVRAVEEQVKVEEQRRARRQTLAVASAIVLVVLLAGGGLLAKGNVDAKREKDRTAAFEEAVREATRLQASGNDFPAARFAAERALGLVGDDPARRREVEALRAAVEAAATAADRAAAKAKGETDLLAALDEVSLRRGDHFDAKRTDAEYAAALPDLAALDGFDRRVELAAHLDQWVWQRRKRLPDLEWSGIDARARALDPDEWRVALRGAAAAGDRDRLRALASDPKTAAQGPRSLALLGTVLADGGDKDAAAALLARAAEQYPGDFWIRFHLGDYAGGFELRSGRFARPQPAVEHLTAAVALRPASSGAHDNLGVALWSAGRLDAAIETWRVALRLDPSRATVHHNLGIGLRDKGDFDASIASLREAIRLDPGHAYFHASLGSTFDAKGDLDAAIDAFRRSLRIDAKNAAAHNSLGVAFGRKGDLDGALAACREAVRLDPTFSRPHLNIGFALFHKGDLDGAIASQREAIRLDPNEFAAYTNLALALIQKRDFDGAIEAFREAIRRGASDANVPYNLGNLLGQKGDHAGASEAFREAIRLDPKLATAHTNLGNTLKARGDLAGAIACYHDAIRADPNLALAHANLGHALGMRGELAPSVESLRKAASLDPKHPWIQSALAEAEGLAAAHARLAAVQRGEDLPKSAGEWRTLALAAYRAKDHATSVRCWKEAFASDPSLADDLPAGNRYDAACAASLAGAEHHEQALDWLRADLRAWRDRPASDAKAVAQTLRHWRTDLDLHAVRDVGGLSEGWRALWADVDASLAKLEKAPSETR